MKKRVKTIVWAVVVLGECLALGWMAGGAV